MKDIDKPEYRYCIEDGGGKLNVMPKKLKVWGGTTTHNGKQVRAIIATTTKKKAVELLNISRSYFNVYWCETGNKAELGIALNKPEVIFVEKTRFKQDYRPI